MMKFKMTLVWKIWCFAVLLFMVFMLLSVQSASSSGRELRLTPGQEVKWRVWRPFDSEMTPLKLRYHRSIPREKLGKDFAYCNRSEVTDEFICKGENIGLTVSLNGNPACFLKAEDNGFAYSAEFVWRRLHNIGNCGFSEKSGMNIWKVKVETVSPRLVNKFINIEAEAPLGLKNLYGSNYVWLFFISIFWLVLAGILLVWGGVLWYIHQRK